MTVKFTAQNRLALSKYRKQLQQRLARGEIDFFSALDQLKSLADPTHEPKGQILTMEMRGMLQVVFDQLEGRMARGDVDVSETLDELEAMVIASGAETTRSQSAA